ncbi:MAG: hypothetical protein JWQ09_1130 [Segetibacter sp.]|nr:hypothetical protein [Segetibacter sp.]
MNILKAIRNGIEKTIEDITKPKRVEEGEGFEKFARDEIFIKDWYEITEKTHSFNENKKDYIKQSLNPDFKLKDRITKKEFWVEVKYKEEYHNKIYICSPEQLKRYKEKNETSFILIGIGGNYNNPNDIFLIPTKEIKYNNMYINYLFKYRLETIPIKSWQLWKTTFNHL